MSTLCICTCVLCICVKYLNVHIVCIGIYVYHCVHEYLCVCIFVWMCPYRIYWYMYMHVYLMLCVQSIYELDYVCTCVSICMCTWMCMWMCPCIHWGVCAHVFVPLSANGYVNVYRSVCVSVSSCVYVCYRQMPLSTTCPSPWSHWCFTALSWPVGSWVLPFFTVPIFCYSRYWGSVHTFCPFSNPVLHKETRFVGIVMKWLPLDRILLWRQVIAPLPRGPSKSNLDCLLWCCDGLCVYTVLFI